MTSPTSVDIHAMVAAQGDFQTALDQVNTAYADMDEQRGMLAAHWSGEASSIFGGALQNWLDDFNVVRGQLSGLLETLSANTGVYARTHEGSQQVANSFAHGLGNMPGLPGL
jgi:WXG100 family type VII secretion target